MWKEKPQGDLEDLKTENKEEKKTPPVLLRYKDPQQYRDIFEPLIKLEADYDKNYKESQTQRNIRIRFENKGKKKLAFFNSPNEDNVRLVTGDELKISYDLEGVTKWKSRGTIVKISSNEEICLELKNARNIPDDPKIKFTIEFIWKSTSFDRQRLALKIF